MKSDYIKKSDIKKGISVIGEAIVLISGFIFCLLTLAIILYVLIEIVKEPLATWAWSICGIVLLLYIMKRGDRR